MISTATYCNPHLAGCCCWTLGCWLGCHITKYLNITPVGLENPRLTLNISKPALGDIQHNCCRCWHVGNHPRRCPWCPRASHWELHDFGSILVHLKSPKKNGSFMIHDVANMCKDYITAPSLFYAFFGIIPRRTRSESSWTGCYQGCLWKSNSSWQWIGKSTPPWCSESKP